MTIREVLFCGRKHGNFSEVEWETNFYPDLACMTIFPFVFHFIILVLRVLLQKLVGFFPLLNPIKTTCWDKLRLLLTWFCIRKRIDRGY